MPAVGTSPYDNADYVLNLARSQGNDAIQSIAGNLLNDNQPYVPQYLNAGYRYLQLELARRGHARFKRTVYIRGLTPVSPLDPETRTILSYTGYFDGSQNYATPMLPSDLCWPLRLRERQSNSTQIPRPMFLARDGLQPRPQFIWLRDWVWEADSIQFCGATQSNDIELYYAPFLPEIGRAHV